MNRISLSLLLLALVAVPVAGQQCSVTSAAAILRAEGMAERAGDVVLNCTRAAPGAPLQGTVNLFLSTPFTNRVSAGTIDLQLAVGSGSSWVPLEMPARLVAPSFAVFENVSLIFDATGAIALRISNIRTPGASPVNATLSFSGSPILAVTTPFVVVGVPQHSLLSATIGTLASPVTGLPDPITFNSLLSAGIPVMTTRVTEGFASALEPKQAGADQGIRVLLRFSNIPIEARLLLPDAVTGTTAPVATSAGNMGLPASGGQWAPAVAPFLMLSRVRNADPTGAGGTLAVAPPDAITTFSAVSDADRFGGIAYAVYEVLTANPAVLESAQIPAFLAVPVGNTQTGRVDQTASFAPAVGLAGTTPGESIPRFNYAPAPLDCTSIGDCNASYFPRLQIQLEEPLEFLAEAGANAIHKDVLIRNSGGSLLEWRITPRYNSGSGWLSVLPAQGINFARVRIDASATSLQPGTYRADLMIEALAPAVGQAVPVSLEVRVPGPPTVPAQSVVNAASRSADEIAPGSLALILGKNLPAKVEVLFNSIAARVVAAQANEILVEVPADLPTEVAASVVVRSDGFVPARLTTGVVQIAPAIFGALNRDWTRNPAAAPAAPGDVLQVFATGLRLSSGPITARIHDRVIDSPLYAGPAPGLPGMEQVNFIIPGDLPSMNTEVFVCGTVASQPDEKVCSRPYVVELLRRD